MIRSVPARLSIPRIPSSRALHLAAFAFAAVAAPVLPFSAGSAAAQSSPEPVPTFSEAVAPILCESCVRCHQPDGIGPMSLLSYEEARPWARVLGGGR